MELDDFANLRRAAIDKLHESQRHRMGVLPGQKDTKLLRTVDLHKIGRYTKKLIVQQALSTEDQDQERFLKKIGQRMDRVGIELATTEVRCEHLTLEANIQLGNRALPTVLNSYRDFFEGLFQKLRLMQSSMTHFAILEDVSAIIPPGRMTLLLGPPGSGKSTLLAALAGKLQASNLKMHGNITYNGHTFQEFIPQMTAAYITQTDTHLPELTVRETFDFAARAQGTGYKADELRELHKREAEQNLEVDWEIDAFMTADTAKGKREAIASEYILRILGLDVCADTPVGNQMIRGISGGQKKRVTTGEMIVGPKKTLFMDEVSTGLDSSTTFQIIKCLRDFAHLRLATVFISLLQPPPEVFNLFDDVMLLSEGQLVYHGPREEVVPFFASCGFQCPPRKAVPDFLQELTSRKDQQQYWAGQGLYTFVPVQHFSKAFKNSPTGQRNAEALAQPYDKALHKKEALVHTKRSLTGMQALKALMRREATLVQRNSFLYIFKAVQATFTSIICATLFLRTHLAPDGIDNAHLYAAFLFFASLQMFFNGIAEMTFTIDRMEVFFKQRDDLFFPSWAFVVPTTILRLPVSFVESLIWTVITYYPVGLAPQASRFFMSWLLLFLVHNMAISIFRAIGAIARNIVVANACGAMMLMVLLMLGGFVLPRGQIHGWWIWGYWIDPLQYGMRALLINEFTAPRWQQPYPTNPDENLGKALLAVFNFPTHYWWVWLGVGALVAYIILFNVICVLAHKLLAPYGVQTAVMSEESLKEREFTVKGDQAKSGQLEVEIPSQGVDRQDASASSSSDKHVESGTSHHTQGSVSSALQDVEAGPHDDDTVPDRILDSSMGIHIIPTKGLNGDDTVPDTIMDGGMGTGLAPSKGLRAEGKNLDSSMGIGPTSHKSLASSEAAASAAAPVSHRNLSGLESAVLGGNSFRESGVEKGMVLPFTPLAMSFSDVHYYVDVPAGVTGDNVKEFKGKPQLELLRGISGAFRPGVLTCLMGVSGAGKTTLMDVLAGRKTSGHIEGDIRMNGHVKEQTSFARVSGYVEQNDVHSPQTTVREALEFSAQLRFAQGVPADTIEAFVDEVMGLVELTSLQRVLVGVAGHSGLSVEQRKRLTIAVELVANPSIVFMDEPTSGLDARAAAIVMRTVRNIVNTGRTIVCTIHQPSIDIFESFDELLLLKRGGQTIYAGHLGKNSKDLINYYEAIPGVQPIPDGLNPATWMLEVTKPGNEERMGVDFAAVFDQGSLCRRQQVIIEEVSKPDPEVPALHFDNKYPCTAQRQYLVCLKKFYITFWRTPAYNATRFSFTIGIALLFGTMFWKLGDKTDTEQRITNTLGALYVATLFLGVLNSIFVQPVISDERAVFYRERAAGMYAVEPWYLAMATIEAMYLIIQATVYTCIVYFMAGFAKDAGKFFWFLLFMVETLLYFTYYGVVCVAITPNLLAAAVASNSLYLVMNLFSGFVIPAPHIPGWWIGAYWMNPVTWSLYGLVVSNIGDEDNNIVHLTNGGTTTVPEFLRDRFGYRHEWEGWVVIVLAAFAVFFWGAGALAFKKLNFQQR
ncbi:hypothetical protein WJX77_010449 [Trebouxia sp. C0004]